MADGTTNIDKYINYQANGGTLGYDEWISANMPESDNAAKSDNTVNSDKVVNIPPKPTLTLPEGYEYYLVYTDAYDPIWMVREKQVPNKTYKTHDEAKAAAPSADYTPVQQSDGSWVLSYNPLDTNKTYPDYTTARLAAPSADYTPVQQSDGSWVLSYNPQSTTTTSPINPFETDYTIVGADATNNQILVKDAKGNLKWIDASPSQVRAAEQNINQTWMAGGGELSTPASAAAATAINKPITTTSPTEPMRTYTDPSTGMMYDIYYNPSDPSNPISIPKGQDPTWKKPTTQPTIYPLPAGYAETYMDTQTGYIMKWNPYTGDYDVAGVDLNWKQTLTPEQQANINYQNEQLSLQQQQLAYQQQQDAAQRAADKEKYAAQLKANPQSWLEYYSYTGEQPAIQPWMIPMMGQEYAGAVAGSPIPNWTGNSATLADLPRLSNPSIQYQARMGPTALAQYQSYQKARTGATPEETTWRLQQQAPPSGYNTSLSWVR